VLLTPVALVLLTPVAITASVVDTGGKFTVGVTAISANLGNGMATGVVVTDCAP
jgi:hypothetical protein